MAGFLLKESITLFWSPAMRALLVVLILALRKTLSALAIRHADLPRSGRSMH